MSDEKQLQDQGTSFIDLCRTNPGFALTLVYLLASMIGMMFSWALYTRFEINYFDYAEISDFLLAAIREPQTFLVAAGAIPVVWLFYRSSLYFYGKFTEDKLTHKIIRWSVDFNSRTHSNLIVQIFIFAAYSVLFVTAYARWKHEQIITGNGRYVSVKLAEHAGPAFAGIDDGKTLFIGATQRVVFLYEPANERALIIPYENIAGILVNPDQTAREQPQTKDQT
ncbi:MAG: hypothetical protein MJA83_12500 [Gammaproteobacteria bacterium]|nr:hypothetical protein [Gammaproteobacteria bacterium]